MRMRWLKVLRGMGVRRVVGRKLHEGSREVRALEEAEEGRREEEVVVLLLLLLLLVMEIIIIDMGSRSGACSVMHAGVLWCALLCFALLAMRAAIYCADCTRRRFLVERRVRGVSRLLAAVCLKPAAATRRHPKRLAPIAAA